MGTQEERLGEFRGLSCVYMWSKCLRAAVANDAAAVSFNTLDWQYTGGMESRVRHLLSSLHHIRSPCLAGWILQVPPLPCHTLADQGAFLPYFADLYLTAPVVLLPRKAIGEANQ